MRKRRFEKLFDMEIQDKEVVDLKRLVDLRSYTDGLVTIPDGLEHVCHYTTIEALLNGIIVKNPLQLGQDICLWGTDATYLNDMTELKIGGRFLKEILSKHFLKFDNETEVDGVHDDLPQSFVTSFSLQRDFLPMWSMYGKNGTGISLCFDVNYLQNKDKCELKKCIYLTDELRDQFETYLDGFEPIFVSAKRFCFILVLLFIFSLFGDGGKAVESCMTFVNPFLELAIVLKHEAYLYENEYRLIKSEQNSDNVKFRIGKNLAIPYIEQYFPKEALREIIVGPNTDMNRTIRSIKTFLKSTGFEHVVVSPSSVPYRG